jgi:hypothetical protein
MLTYFCVCFPVQVLCESDRCLTHVLSKCVQGRMTAVINYESNSFDVNHTACHCSVAYIYLPTILQHFFLSRTHAIQHKMHTETIILSQGHRRRRSHYQ